ncbi:MAG: hypothetical protein KAI74_04870, partial [Kiritimatiellae bacterium]|nr:hypothetical protein [Kiritimatiellia bacterium]
MSKDSHHRIVAFTKDWDDVPTCTTHILREMGKSMPVLWVNSIGTRKPDLRHPSHLKRIIKRLLVGFKRAELKENKIRVLSPILIPKVQSKLTLWINRKLFAWQVGRELRDMGDGGIEYWCFVPNAVDLLPSDKTGVRVVYYCVDDWTKFHYLDTEWVANKERALLKRADIVFAVSRYLERKLKELSEVAVHYMPHGVEYNKFHKALDIDNTPQDMGSIPRPVIGFYGNIYQWVDLGLVMKLAGRRADWGFVMIGDLFVDVSQFADIDNVYFLGRKEHDELPSYCATFNVAIIPYDMSNLRMESVSPVKSRELLA